MLADQAAIAAVAADSTWWQTREGQMGNERERPETRLQLLWVVCLLFSLVVTAECDSVLIVGLGEMSEQWGR